MSMSDHVRAVSPPPQVRYLEQVAPIVFPESEKVPESQLHRDLGTLLYHLLKDTFGPSITVGADQFVYLDAADPKQALAPDVYARREPAQGHIRSWKVWERGAPELAVEIVSESDADDATWQKKLTRYRRLGVIELVRFDAENAQRPLQIWDRVQGALVERQVVGTSAPSLLLDLDWVVAPAEEIACALRIRRAGVLVPTRMEAVAAAQRDHAVEQQARLAEQQARLAEQQARLAAEARIQQLEELLARRS